MIPERRHAPRYELSLEIRAAEVWGVTSNISLEGVMFISPKAFTPGEIISITLFVPTDRSSNFMRLEGSGLVRRSGPNARGEYETAVELDGLRVLTDTQPSELSRRAWPSMRDR